MYKTKYNNWIVLAWMMLGFALAALVCFLNVRQYQIGPMCLVFEDNFEKLDTSVWSHMVTVSTLALLSRLTASTDASPVGRVRHWFL